MIPRLTSRLTGTYVKSLEAPLPKFWSNIGIEKLNEIWDVLRTLNMMFKIRSLFPTVNWGMGEFSLIFSKYVAYKLIHNSVCRAVTGKTRGSAKIASHHCNIVIPRINLNYTKKRRRKKACIKGSNVVLGFNWGELETSTRRTYRKRVQCPEVKGTINLCYIT